MFSALAPEGTPFGYSEKRTSLLFTRSLENKKEMLKEFKMDLKNEKPLQDPITVRTYKDLNKIDKAIIDTFTTDYRKRNNAVYLSGKLHYSVDGIKKRINKINNMLYYNVLRSSESVQNEVT